MIAQEGGRALDGYAGSSDASTRDSCIYSPHATTSLGEGPQRKRSRFVPMSWIEALIAVNEDIIASERRFHRQCNLVVHLAEHGHVPARDEMLLASYMTSLILLRTHRNELLADAATVA